MTDAERLVVLVACLTQDTTAFGGIEDSIGFYVDRATALGDTISRERVIELLKTWDNTPARCCGYRSDLPGGLCAACIRDGKPLDAQDAQLLADHLWAVGKPTRIALANAVAEKLNGSNVLLGYRNLASRLLIGEPA